LAGPSERSAYGTGAASRALVAAMAKKADPNAPMEALLAEALPDGPGWQYEPKWDGFRCLARRAGPDVELISKSGKPLARYFPDMVERISALKANRFLIDGELVIPTGDALSFEALQLRLHPAESRVRKLAAQTPAQFILFDILELDGERIEEWLQSERRAVLERFLAANPADAIRLSPATTDRDTALAWLKKSGGALDGVIAKRLDLPYRHGERAMIKVKQRRTADCVVGGFRYASKAREVGSLLLGLYDDEDILHHVGFTSAISASDRPKLTKVVEKLRGGPGFTGRAPGGPSRWSNARSDEWEPLKPELVVEVRYDQVTDRRFRHGAALLRFRPDKAPAQCTFEQLAPALNPAKLKVLFG
jgi:ATP-dependent DNA ligase